MRKNLFGALVLFATLGVALTAARRLAVVTDGRFTNIYVYQPSFPGESWDQHVAEYWNGHPKPTDYGKFTRASIDAFVDALMTPGSPSYFDRLHQYSGINPPRFYGSGMASQSCVAAAMKDARNGNGVMQWDTIRSLSNCHLDGHDPSPQVNLIFSPDIKIGNTPTQGSGDLCLTSVQAWHWAGLNTPNFVALPTNKGCAPSFDTLTTTLSHEIVETLTNPAGFGVSGVLDDPANLGKGEVGDRCEGKNLVWPGPYTVTQYWSAKDRSCQPTTAPRAASSSVQTPEITWLDAKGLPLVRFTDTRHDHQETVPSSDVGQEVLKLQLIMSTGNDNLRGGKDNCDVTILLKGGRTIALPNVNHSAEWPGWSINTIDVPLPSGGIRGGDVTAIQLHVSSVPNSLTDTPDNWNLERMQLKASVLVPLIGSGNAAPKIDRAPVAGNMAAGAPFDGVWVENVYAKNSKYVVRITSKQTPFGTVRVASYQISVNELLDPGGAKVTFETTGTDLTPTLARTAEEPTAAEHIILPNGVTLYLYRIMNNGKFLNYGIRYVRFADHLNPDKKSSTKKKLVDVILQPLQTPVR